MAKYPEKAMDLTKHQLNELTEAMRGSDAETAKRHLRAANRSLRFRFSDEELEEILIQQKFLRLLTSALINHRLFTRDITGPLIRPTDAAIMAKFATQDMEQRYSIVKCRELRQIMEEIDAWVEAQPSAQTTLEEIVEAHAACWGFFQVVLDVSRELSQMPQWMLPKVHKNDMVMRRLLTRDEYIGRYDAVQDKVRQTFAEFEANPQNPFYRLRLALQEGGRPPRPNPRHQEMYAQLQELMRVEVMKDVARIYGTGLS